MQTQLAELNQALAENLQSRSQLDSILEETESAYSKIVEGSQVRAHTSCRVLQSFPVCGFVVQPTGSRSVCAVLMCLVVLLLCLSCLRGPGTGVCQVLLSTVKRSMPVFEDYDELP